jgi:hypothetical protein
MVEDTGSRNMGSPALSVWMFAARAVGHCGRLDPGPGGRWATPVVNRLPTEHLDRVTLVCYGFINRHSCVRIDPAPSQRSRTGLCVGLTAK